MFPTRWSIPGSASNERLPVPVILWTDVLVFVLAVAVLAYFVHVHRQPHLLIPWRRVTQSAYGMSALVVLTTFVTIGLLDSIHYRPTLESKAGQGTAYSTEVSSVFDALASPLRDRRERTYSAPFATRAYARETLEIPGLDGKVRQVREFPRLTWGGAHLKEEARRNQDVFGRAALGMALAALAWLALAGAVAWRHAHASKRRLREAWRAIWGAETRTPWRAILITAGALLALAGPVRSEERRVGKE